MDVLYVPFSEYLIKSLGLTEDERNSLQEKTLAVLNPMDKFYNEIVSTIKSENLSLSTMELFYRMAKKVDAEPFKEFMLSVSKGVASMKDEDIQHFLTGLAFLVYKLHSLECTDLKDYELFTGVATDMTTGYMKLLTVCLKAVKDAKKTENPLEEYGKLRWSSEHGSACMFLEVKKLLREWFLE